MTSLYLPVLHPPTHLAQSREAELEEERENLYQVHAPTLRRKGQSKRRHERGDEAVTGRVWGGCDSVGPEKIGHTALGPGSYLGGLQILQHEVPELGRRVQQQELEASRSDTRWLSRFSTRNGERRR